MHKLESFALSSGSKISKPHIEKCFYPTKNKKFICISSQSESESKSYDFFNDVIFHIKPYLEENNISVYQIGNSDSRKIFYSEDYLHLNRLQSSYLISKSLLYLGNYNLYANIASHMQKPFVFPTNIEYIESFKPYWAEKDKFAILSPESDLKPSFSPQEHPKTINMINPEDVAIKVLDLLNIKHSLSKIETIFVGDEYKQNIIDIVPRRLPNIKYENIWPSKCKDG